MIFLFDRVTVMFHALLARRSLNAGGCSMRLFSRRLPLGLARRSLLTSGASWRPKPWHRRLAQAVGAGGPEFLHGAPQAFRYILPDLAIIPVSRDTLMDKRRRHAKFASHLSGGYVHSHHLDADLNPRSRSPDCFHRNEFSILQHSCQGKNVSN